jgi:SagB-type dehydrogenase family enzyme
VVLPDTGGLSWLRQVNGTTRIRWMRGTVPLGLAASPRIPGSRPTEIRLAPGRAVPSSGARYPIEVYVATGATGDHAAGLYHYDPAHHVLEQVRAGDFRARIGACLDATTPGRPEIALVLSTVFWRNCAKYGPFGYRLQCLDAGVVLTQTLAVAHASGLTGTIHLSFADEDLDELLGLTPAGEAVLAAVTLTAGPGDERETPRAGRPGSAGPHTNAGRSERTGPGPVECPPATDIRAVPELAVVVELHEAARRRYPAGDPGRLGTLPTSAPVGLPPPGADIDLASGLHRRRTVYGYRPRPLPRPDLARILAVATGPITADVALVTAVGLVATAVDGIGPGAYRYDRRRHGLVPSRGAHAVPALVRAALNPALAEECRDASLTLAPIGDASAWLAAFGDRGYRMQTITAGIVAQRVCLAAAALGLASHVHCDVDTAGLNDALGLGDGPVESLVLVTVGTPRSDRLDPQHPL